MGKRDQLANRHAERIGELLTEYVQRQTRGEPVDRLRRSISRQTRAMRRLVDHFPGRWRRLKRWFGAGGRK